MCIKTAVITGFHSFDVPNFYSFFKSLEGIDADIMHMENYASCTKEARDKYDVLVFYNMPDSMPYTGDDLPWHAGDEMKAITDALDGSKGIFILHHALLAYKKWDVWSSLTGTSDRGFKYKQECTMEIEILKEHPITKGIENFTIIDEAYILDTSSLKSEILMKTNHPDSMNEIAWCSEYAGCRIFSLALGHDNEAWANPSFIKTTSNGIKWCAGTI